MIVSVLKPNIIINYHTNSAYSGIKQIIINKQRLLLAKITKTDKCATAVQTTVTKLVKLSKSIA